MRVLRGCKLSKFHHRSFMALVNRTVTLPAEIWQVAEDVAERVGLSQGDLYRDCFIDGLERQVEKYKSLGLLLEQAEAREILALIRGEKSAADEDVADRLSD